ncbi:MAG: hypothetical protein E7351_03160 [Clostridiales bacterium]|nr:hypothetical protein [Clostridiales bacterium]
MEFINTMKKREFLEMGLKALASILAAFLAIILMEGMIYSIELNALKTKGHTGVQSINTSTTAYCIKQGEDKYFVVYHNPDNAIEGQDEWAAIAGEQNYKTRAQCEALSAKEVVFQAPNAFIFTIDAIDYVIMSVFVAIVAGYFVYRFLKLKKSYEKLVEEYKTTGTIEIVNV